MPCLLVLLVALAAPHGASALEAAQGTEERPVNKVINLLTDMKKQIGVEAEKDKELFDNFNCWCETYGKEKTKAVEDAGHQINELTAAIEEYTAKVSQLQTETAQLTQEVAEKAKALKEAESIRAEEKGEFATT